MSNESGGPEIYIRAFTVAPDGKPSIGTKWRVSDNGGTAPRWRGDGKELFYRLVTGDFMAVDVQPGDNAIQTALPHKLFQSPGGVRAWDVTSDGHRFLVSIPLRSEVTASPDPITVVLNWKTALSK
jgi:eukaryotic-like serine/threonine-protein kinase